MQGFAGQRQMRLADRRILLIVSGSISAYKVLELTRLLRKAGAVDAAFVNQRGRPLDDAGAGRRMREVRRDEVEHFAHAQGVRVPDGGRRRISVISV